MYRSEWSGSAWAGSKLAGSEFRNVQNLTAIFTLLTETILKLAPESCKHHLFKKTFFFLVKSQFVPFKYASQPYFVTRQVSSCILNCRKCAPSSPQCIWITSSSVDYTSELCQHSQPTASLPEFVRTNAEVVLQFLKRPFFPIRNWQRHLNRLFVISHTDAGVSCLSGKTLLISSCQKLWISPKGKIASAGMHLLCLVEKVSAIIRCRASLSFEKLRVRR